LVVVETENHPVVTEPQQHSVCQHPLYVRVEVLGELETVVMLVLMAHQEAAVVEEIMPQIILEEMET
jgi:hypothetical protein|tara:strand:- start:204 stop:404 length:201 start_codon:yes stop_codon:yes gene_type:complete